MSVLRSMRPFLFTAAALAAPIPALAQDVTEATETVVVSTSRISLKGYEAPTPVTEIGLEKIERDAKMDIGDLIREMPATGASPSLNNGGNAINVSQGDAGLDTVSLRNLGIATHPGAVRRPAGGVVQPAGRRRRSEHPARDPGQARRCGDRRRFGRLGLRRRGRRGQSGPGQGVRGHQGQCDLGRRAPKSISGKWRWKAPGAPASPAAAAIWC